jgi:multiple sugar transport system ATP-binding protein
MVFQNYALYPHMTVFENMAFGLRRRKFPEAEVAKRVQAAAELLGLQVYLQRRPRELSGGERQRVALGRAMVRDPQVFLFDEPLSNLDAKLRVQMRAEIKRLHQRVKATMIYVTHDQVEAMTLGDRIAVLKKGVMQQVADPFTLYQHPANQFVAGFIGSPPINFFTASVQADGQTLDASGCRDPAAGGVRRPARVGARRAAWCSASVPRT